MSKIIVITGATSDIGLDFIKSIKDECLILAQYNSNKDKLIELQTATNCTIVPIGADFNNEDNILKFIQEIEGYGVPDCVIHLAAPKFANIRFRDISWENFQSEFNISFRSIMLILNAIMPKMAILKRGRVICMLSSVTIGVPPKALTQYTTIKYSLLGLMKSLASEYGEKGVTVNSISPSMIETGFLSNINEKIIEISAQNNPLKRNATPSDITPTILMLMDEKSAYINGVNIPITGGSNF